MYANQCDASTRTFARRTACMQLAHMHWMHPAASHNDTALAQTRYTLITNTAKQYNSPQNTVVHSLQSWFPGAGDQLLAALRLPRERARPGVFGARGRRLASGRTENGGKPAGGWQRCSLDPALAGPLLGMEHGGTRCQVSVCMSL